VVLHRSWVRFGAIAVLSAVHTSIVDAPFLGPFEAPTSADCSNCYGHLYAGDLNGVRLWHNGAARSSTMNLSWERRMSGSRRARPRQ